MTGQTAARTRTLLEAVRLISASGHDLDATLDLLIEQARRLFRAPDVAINLVEPATGQFIRRRPSALAGPNSPFAVVGAPALMDALAREAVATRRAVFVPDVRRDPRVDPAVAAEMPTVVTALIVPLSADDEWLGMMTVRWTTARAVEPDEVELAEALGTHAAVAIRTARLIERARRDAQQAERNQALLEALARARTREEVGAAIVGEGMAAVGAGAGLVALVAADGAEAEIVWQGGYPAELVARWARFPLAAPVPLAEVLRTGEPIFAESDAAIVARYPALAGPGAVAYHGAIATLPLRLADRVIGALGFSFATDRRIEPAERRALATLAQRCALALERARLYDELRSTTERYRVATEAAALAVWEWDRRSDAVRWSGRGRALFGYEGLADESDVAWWDERIHPDDRAQVWAEQHAVTATSADHLSQEYRFRRADGTYARCLTVARFVYDDAGEPLRGLGVVADVTRTREAEEERDRLAEALARADERDRVAMDLHDNLVQMLYGAALTVGAAQREVAADPAATASALARAATTIGTTIESVRGYMESLRSPEPPIGGLRAGLEAIAGEFSHGEPPSRITVRVTGRVDASVPHGVVGDVLLIAREAVSNAVRHGHAPSIAVRAACWRRRLVLTVRDDGVGFDPATATGGRGLANLAARARRLGAALSVESAPGEGARVRLDLPLPRLGAGGS